jgi:hypothetical protein
MAKRLNIAALQFLGPALRALGASDQRLVD